MKKIQVRLLEAYSTQQLETNINSFLATLSTENVTVEVQIMTTGTNNNGSGYSTYNNFMYIAKIIYSVNQ